MANRTFYLLVALVTVGCCAFGIYQGLNTGGYLFYANGIDESSYLQFDYSNIVAKLSGPSRPGQYLVSFLHNIGLSGGWINFLCDMLFVPLCFLLLRNALLKIASLKLQANFVAFTTLTAAVFFSNFNFIFNNIYDIISGSKLSSFVVTPTVAFPLWIRSPEPQFSLALLLVALNIALHLKRFLPVYVALPFTYPFVGVPAGLITLSLNIEKKIRSLGISMLLAFIAVSFLLLVEYRLFMADEAKAFTTPSIVPIISLTGLLAFLLFLLLRNKLEEQSKLCLLGAISLWLCVNTQLISGWFIQPCNYEQYFGPLVLGYTLAVALSKSGSSMVRNLTVFFLSALFLCFSISDFLESKRVTDPVVLTPELLSQLRTDPNQIAVSDIKLASWMNLILPQQHPTLLAITQAYGPIARQTYGNYQCVRSIISRDPELSPRFENVFNTLDAIYKWNNQDYFANHLGRKYFDPAGRLQYPVEKSCPSFSVVSDNNDMPYLILAKISSNP